MFASLHMNRERKKNSSTDTLANRKKGKVGQFVNLELD
jgi:hypothetical protein